MKSAKQQVPARHRSLAASSLQHAARPIIHTSCLQQLQKQQQHQQQLLLSQPVQQHADSFLWLPAVSSRRCSRVMCRASAKGAPAAPAPAAHMVSEPAVGQRLGAAYSEEGNMPDWHKGRRAGVLLHPTSLPGPNGIGELGKEAFKFVDWLRSAGMQCWQVLPLVPPDPKYYSPYSGLDTNCGNPLVIDLEALITEGLLDAADRPAAVPEGDVQFEKVAAVKQPLLSKAVQTLMSGAKFAGLRQSLAEFRAVHPRLEDSALFDVLRQQPDLADLYWWEWPEPLRFRKPAAIKDARKKFKQQIDEYIAIQFLFDRQWKALKTYANGHGIKLIGDMPIYVGGQSSDVWANRHLFELNEETCAPEDVSGVPPDAFSATGQLWGNPLYRWTAHESEDYEWWAHRMRRAMQLYDETRIDHFRAFAGYWSVPATAETAMSGWWRQGPGLEFFKALKRQLGRVPIMAEDLGVITTDVVKLRQDLGAPGMVVLQFAWGGGPSNVHLPHMHYQNSFCYPGTHDNETAVGWFAGSANEIDKKYLKQYLGSDGSDIAWDFIRAAMMSVSNTSVILLQDIMRLDNSARMNVPGKAAGNWAWRVGSSDVWLTLADEAAELKRLAYIYDRLPKGAKYDD